MHAKTSDIASTRPVLLAISIAGGTLAYADPVRFDNDGSFVWSDDVFLDLTLPAEEQTGQALPGRASFQYDLRPDNYYTYSDKLIRGSTPDSQVIEDTIITVRAAGALVPDGFVPDGYWTSFGTLGYYYQSGTFYTQFDQPIGTPGEPGYIAARFSLNDQTHYGWMSLRVHRDLGPRPNRFFELLAWGYETEPNTPIVAGAVPGPSGALALLAFGAAAGATRARRE